MRLLNVETLQLEVFDGGPRVTFAILSHTWGEEEVSFQDMMTFSPGNTSQAAQAYRPHLSGPQQQPQFHPQLSAQKNLKPVESKKGFSKIVNCCAKTRAEGYQYVWIDTCCIDKSSSAELSEAINSMFKWYHEAEVCYALLSDVSLDAIESQEEAGGNKMSAFDLTEYGDGQAGRLSKALHKSRWFSRGWTLQELVAPLEVVFVDSCWKEIGTRETLAGVVEEITGIDGAVLRMERSLGEFSVAQRMSWAANRNTSRIEDEAYCLMGLFDVSMPLLYGEGRKAFKRLQLEIMRQSTDRSILAWASPDSHGVIEGVLASSPAMFEDCGGIHWTPPSSSTALPLRTRGLHDGKDNNNILNYNACHDIIGFSLRMKAGVLEPPRMGQLVFREYWDFADKDGNMMTEPPGGRTGDHPLADLVHFPRDVGELYTHAREFREFDYGFLRHKNRTVVLVMLDGCTKRGGNSDDINGPRAEYTVGITLCSDTDGLMKRVHFPSRFLIPKHIDWAFTDNMRTLHASLSGSQVLQQPILPNFAKCMVRVPDMSELPYRLAYTIPSMADSSPGVWYLERWGTIPDLASLDLQPCFSLHRTGTGRAMVFHHKTDPTLSFAIIFTLMKEGRALYPTPPRSTSTAAFPAPPPISRQSTTSINSLTSSISSLSSTLSRTFTSSSTTTSTSISSPSGTTFSPDKFIPPTTTARGPTSSTTAGTKPQTQKQFFLVSFVSGPEANKLGFETDLAPHLSSPPAPGEIKQPTYSYEFDLPDGNFSLTVKVRKAPKVSNAGGKNYNALLGFVYKSMKNKNC